MAFKKKGGFKAPDKPKKGKDEPKMGDSDLKSPMTVFRGKPKSLKRPAGRKR